MEKTSTRIPYPVFKPDYSELNRLFSTEVLVNDVDIALRNRNLRSFIESSWSDMSVPDSPSAGLTDAQMFDAFVEKGVEDDELIQFMREYESDYKSKRSS